jgi:aryl-alcohol dehydrogenase-like predicted oxidoreductase
MTTQAATHATKQLGSHGPAVFPLALGCMGMSPIYGAIDEDESIATIHAAIDHGVNVIDTGDFYGVGHNELLLRRALAGRRDKVLLSVKFGALRGPDGAWLGIDARPVAVKNAVAHSLTRLGVEVIDIYRPARLDPSVPIEDTIGAIAELIKAGYVRHIGLSEVGPETIRRAHAVHPIADLQIEYALISRAPEAKIFPVLEELGISATLYGVLARGLLGGSVPQASAGDYRAHLPRFSAEHAATNEAVVARLRAFAAARDLTPGQAAIAWVLAKQPRLVPVIGARKRAQLEALIPAGAIAGDRYQAAQMAHLDSER